MKSSYYSGLISAGPETGCDRITPSLPSAESDLNSDVGFRCDSVPWILGSDSSIFYTALYEEIVHPSKKECHCNAPREELMQHVFPMYID